MSYANAAWWIANAIIVARQQQATVFRGRDVRRGTWCLLLCLLALTATRAEALTITSSASGNWSAGATWSGGVAPTDGNAVVIAAGNAVLMDTSAGTLTGIASVTITGTSSGTPGKLYFANGTNGSLTLATGGTIGGTSATILGQLIASKDGAYYTSTSSTNGVASGSTARINLGTTGTIVAKYLNVELLGTDPATLSARTFGTLSTISSVNLTSGTLTMTSGTPQRQALPCASNRLAQFRQDLPRRPPAVPRCTGS